MSKDITQLEDVRCCICSKYIEPLRNAKGEIVWEYGHNADPVKEGRCCEQCNFEAVLPARMEQLIGGK
tara:strand:+ start:2136 stop:2339 length:204 start_codon:yes stop_codon:yes gene_type:complete